MYEDGSFPLTVADEITKALQKQISKKPIEEEKQYSEDYGFNSDIQRIDDDWNGDDE